MDNLSHSLFGLAAAELVHRSLAAEPDSASQRARRRLLLFAGWAASNCPDLDLFATGLLPSPLGYLLHHRGHTHTLLYALPQALLLAGLVWLAWPGARALLRASAPARAGLSGCLGGGLALHLGFDYLNSYGLHPFYPFDARWLFGDLVFIVEPLFWIAFGVPLAMSLGAGRRVALLALLAAAVALGTAKGYLLWGSAAALALAALGLGALGWRAGARGRAALAAGMALATLFVALQAGSAALVRRELAGALGAGPDASVLADAALTAYPSNPLCWNVATVERRDAAASYRVRRAVVSAAPALLAAGACPFALGGARAAAAHGASLPGDARVLLVRWEHDSSLQRLRLLTRDDCRFAAWMRFARVPSIAGDSASDARFGAGENFTTLPLRYSAFLPCPAHVPPWGMPRADLLAPP